MHIISINSEIINEGFKRIIENEGQTKITCLTDIESFNNNQNNCIYIIGFSKLNETIYEILKAHNKWGIIFIDTKNEKLKLNKVCTEQIRGVISMENTKEEILSCIKRITLGETYFNKIEPTGHKKENEIQLSDRETEILNMISQGKTLFEISEELFLSLNTVTTHKRNILKKTGFNKMTKLIAWWSNI